MQKYRIIATAEVYDTAENMPKVIENAMKTLKKKFENGFGQLAVMPSVIADQSNGGIVTITLKGEDNAQ